MKTFAIYPILFKDYIIISLHKFGCKYIVLSTDPLI